MRLANVGFWLTYLTTKVGILRHEDVGGYKIKRKQAQRQ